MPANSRWDLIRRLRVNKTIGCCTEPVILLKHFETHYRRDVCLVPHRTENLDKLQLELREMKPSLMQYNSRTNNLIT